MWKLLSILKTFHVLSELALVFFEEDKTTDIIPVSKLGSKKINKNDKVNVKYPSLGTFEGTVYEISGKNSSQMK